MAIIFTKNPAVSIIQNAFNNNIVEFNSNVPVDYNKCEIDIAYLSQTYKFVITPIQGVFYFNLKEIVSKIAKENDFKDELTSINLGVNSYDLFFSLNATFTVFLTSGGTDTPSTQFYNFYKSIMQINNPYPNVFGTTATLDIVNYNTLTMFKGYPFDFSVFSLNDISLLNTTTNETAILPTTQTQNRVFFSNGTTLGSFEARVLGLSGGFLVSSSYVTENKLIKDGLNKLQLSESLIKTDLNLTLKDYCGVYLKYFNNYGNYSYWLFEDVYDSRLSVKTKGTVNVDFKDIDETFVTELTTGKLAEKIINLRSKNLDNNQRLQLESLFVSPRVEMYLGSKDEFLTSYENKWQTVILEDGTFTQETSKRDLSNIVISIRLPYYSI